MTDESILNIETIEELDDYLHKQVMDHMNHMEKGLQSPIIKPVKLVFSDRLNIIGMENITQMLMMRSVERALNDPEINKRKISFDELTDLSMNSDVLDSDEENQTFENTVLPILIGNKNVTYH